jgi:hypothetical protein
MDLKISDFSDKEIKTECRKNTYWKVIKSAVVKWHHSNQLKSCAAGVPEE